MASVIETALPKRGAGRGERATGPAGLGPDVEQMRHPRRYRNGVPIVDEPAAEQVQDEFSAIEVDASARLTELAKMRQRLAPEALTNDSNAESELQAVLAEIRAAEGALENVALARRERARRATVARDAAVAEARATALAEAQRLQVERMTAARGVDSGFRKAATALADYHRICADQQRLLSAAGRRGGLAPSSSIERALAHALTSAGTPPGVIELPPLSGKPQPLSELDPRHVEAVTVTTSSGETEQRSENDG